MSRYVGLREFKKKMDACDFGYHETLEWPLQESRSHPLLYNRI
jgi:hypothetical protein